MHVDHWNKRGMFGSRDHVPGVFHFAIMDVNIMENEIPECQWKDVDRRESLETGCATTRKSEILSKICQCRSKGSAFALLRRTSRKAAEPGVRGVMTGARTASTQKQPRLGIGTCKERVQNRQAGHYFAEGSRGAAPIVPAGCPTGGTLRVCQPGAQDPLRRRGEEYLSRRPATLCSRKRKLVDFKIGNPTIG
ncbi:hypothetical protein B0H10DRAFT_1952132 [Mycena sp. CBHHK59/15]|nr:hypothetical protein B0H10DRAFT_1952132 [Mycena sp. CBHHK59/15]